MCPATFLSFPVLPTSDPHTPPWTSTPCGCQEAKLGSGAGEAIRASGHCNWGQPGAARGAWCPGRQRGPRKSRSVATGMFQLLLSGAACLQACLDCRVGDSRWQEPGSPCPPLRCRTARAWPVVSRPGGGGGHPCCCCVWGPRGQSGHPSASLSHVGSSSWVASGTSGTCGCLGGERACVVEVPHGHTHSPPGHVCVTCVSGMLCTRTHQHTCPDLPVWVFCLAPVLCRGAILGSPLPRAFLGPDLPELGSPDEGQTLAV